MTFPHLLLSISFTVKLFSGVFPLAQRAQGGNSSHRPQPFTVLSCFFEVLIEGKCEREKTGDRDGVVDKRRDRKNTVLMTE